MPVANLPRAANVLANVAFWGAVHAGTGYVVHRLPLRRLQRDVGPLRIRSVDATIRRCDRIRIRRWKDRLPEAGALFAGGVSKRHLPSADGGGLGRFAVETRRAELGHWLCLLGGPVASLWNPPSAAVAMVAYGAMANAPFIAVQRYNRARVLRSSRRADDRSSAGGAAEARSAASRRTGSSIP